MTSMCFSQQMWILPDLLQLLFTVVTSADFLTMLQDANGKQVCEGSDFGPHLVA